jgi:hypothetical protein
VDEFTPRKAVKAQVRLKLAVDGPAGAGKTWSALALACHIARLMAEARGEPGTGRVLGVDTENETMALYADEFEFEHIVFRAPYTTARYKAAMQQGVIGKFDVMVVDSVTHQWNGEGGIQFRKDALDAAGGNSFTNWSKLSPEHTEFVEYIKQLPIHTICTMRTKTEYVLETNGKGKQQPRKVGMAPVQREGMDYEFSIVFELDAEHNAVATKDRTRLFSDGVPVDLASPEVAAKLWKWLTSGVKVEEATLTQDERVQIAVALKAAGIPVNELAEWVEGRMGYKSTKDIPKSRLVEIFNWIREPREMSGPEKIARQSMTGMGISAVDSTALILKHSRNWDAINAELETMSIVTDQTASHKPEDEAQEAQAGEFYEEDGDVQCVVRSALRKEGAGNREFMEVVVNGRIGKFSTFHNWHKSLMPCLSDSAGQVVYMKVKANEKGVSIEDVSRVGDRFFEKGKLVQPPPAAEEFTQNSNPDAE